MKTLDPKQFLSEIGIKSAPHPIPVTRPTLPKLDDYVKYLSDIWDSKWLTNGGAFHEELEERLTQFLGVSALSLVSNGTLAILLALKAVGIEKGSVITTPFTFPATANCLQWLGIKPIFADVNPYTGNICPKSIAGLIESDTVGVLAVHVYGIPCDHSEISKVCNHHNLKLVYDAAHAFDVDVDGTSILNWGDASTISFHATKLFSTVEGGAVIVPSTERKAFVDRMKNFGIVNENIVKEAGINAKLNELQAAFGLLRLDDIERELTQREAIAKLYDETFKNIVGLHIPTAQQTNLPMLEVTCANARNIKMREGKLSSCQCASNSSSYIRNNAYYPLIIDSDEFGMTRDTLVSVLQAANIYPRKYFYPLCSRSTAFRDLPSSHVDNLPNAYWLEQSVLCLPIYGELELEKAELIADIIHQIAHAI